MKVHELRAQLTIRGLDTTGLKPQLLKRLEEAMRDTGELERQWRVWSVDGTEVGTEVEFSDAVRLAVRSCKGTATVLFIEVPAGFEDAQGVEIFNCFFESYHASGCQDNAGKGPRIAMIAEIGFKQQSIYDYHQCLVWSQVNMSVPKERKRTGLFAATGDFIWYALSNGKDAHSDKYPVLDLRRKVYRNVVGSSCMFEFQARFALSGQAELPFVFSRRFPCRCSPCRAVMAGACTEENMCVIFAASGLFSQHSVAHKETFSLSETLEKKARDKEERKRKSAEKVARLAVEAGPLRENPEMAPNPAAAAMADCAAEPAAASGAASTSASSQGRGGVVFAQVYGAVDAQAVASSRGEGEFQYQLVRRIEEKEVDEVSDEESTEGS